MLKKVKSGFSLVELSLVLIIIALIISAVVSGKSLVTNSKLTMLHSEMQTLRIALGNYINDNKLNAYLNGTNVYLYDLETDGYLEEDTIRAYGDTDVSTKAGTDIFKSKYSGGAWQYAGTADDAIIKFGKSPAAAGDVTALLTGNMAKIFQTKYQKPGAIMMNDKAGADYAAGNTATLLTVYLLNGAQN